MKQTAKSRRRASTSRKLFLEALDARLPLAGDMDDQISEAIVLGTASPTTPRTNSDSISIVGDVDMYRISVTAGQTVDFDIDTSLNGTGGLGSFIRLFNEAGQQLATNDNGMAPGENVVGFDAYLRFTFSTAGFYYLGVSGANNTSYNPITGDGDSTSSTNATGAYTITVTGIPVDNDDTLSESTSFGSITTTPESVDAAINPDVDVDMYRFTVTNGETVDFDIDTTANGPGGLGSFIRIFDSTGAEIAFNNNGVAPGENVLGFDAYLRHTFATGGTYYIGVSNATNTLYNANTGNSDAAGGLHSIGNYTLTVNTAPTPPVDTDDETSEAPSLGTISTTAVTRTGTINPDVDVDMYRFSVNNGQTIDFDIDTAQNGTGGLGSFIRLFDSSGNQIASNNNGTAPGENTLGFDAYLRFTFSSSGTYYLGVSNATNTTYNATTGAGDTSGGANATGDYTLTVQALPVDTDDTLLEAPSFGSITMTADVLNDAIVTDIDVDIRAFTVTAGQVVDFDVDTTTNGPGGLGSFLRIFNSNGQEIAFNDNGVAPGEAAQGFDAYLRFTFATAGTYYVGVSNATNTLYNANTGLNDTAGGQNSIGAYTLTVQTAPVAPNDTDDSLSEALSLGAISTTPLTRSDSINPDVDVDMYRFTASAGQTIDFDIDTTLNGTGGLGSYIRLFDSAGQQLAFNNNGLAPGENTTGFDAYLRFTFTSSGTYYLGVSNANNINYIPSTGDGDTALGANAIGDYLLTVQALPDDTDDTTSEATNLGSITATPVAVSSTIFSDIDVDLYRFTVNSNQTVDFDIDTTANGPGGLGSFLRIFNSAGQEIAFNDNGVAPDETVTGFDAFLRFTFTSSGTYYVGVSNATNTLYNIATGGNDTAGGANSIGDYQLIVRTSTPAGGDPDDTTSEATNLGSVSTSPRTSPDDIATVDDVDLYRFSVSAGQIVDFDIDTALNGSGGLNSTIRLFDSAGNQLQLVNDAAAPGETLGFDAFLRYTFATAGTYYLGVSNSVNTAYDPVSGNGDQTGAGSTTGSYQLIITALPTDPDDQTSEAPNLGTITATPISRTETITPNVDVDLYRFTVAAGDVVDFDIDTLAGSGLNSYLRLFDSSGVELSFNDNAAAPGETAGLDAYIRRTFNTAGTYYVGVSNAGNTGYDAVTGSGDNGFTSNPEGDYTLRVQLVTTPPVGDPDDSLSEALVIGSVTTTPVTVNGTISPDTDVTMYRFTVTANQVVDFDIDTATNGGAGLQSYIRIFNAAGTQINSNDNAAAPGEGTTGFDAYLRHTFTTAGTYYIGVSNSTNTTYDATTGNGDVAGGANGTGSYQLTVVAQPPPVTPTLSISSTSSSISEGGSGTVATITRTSPDITQPLVINLTSSDTTEATVPATVTILANQASATFTITPVNDTIIDGTQGVTITASATGFSNVALIVQVTDNDSAWQNPVEPLDVNGDTKITAFDALAIINYLNLNGPGPVPSTGSPPPYLDVNSDNLVTAFDALAIINWLNTHPIGSAPEAIDSAGEERSAPAAADAALYDAYFAELGRRERQRSSNSAAAQ